MLHSLLLAAGALSNELVSNTIDYVVVDTQRPVQKQPLIFGFQVSQQVHLVYSMRAFAFLQISIIAFLLSSISL